MKKTLVSALTTALVVGAASTTFAAANPFADVPADHWAYDAVSELQAKGVVNGYAVDNTFRGNQNMTRYEMAQIVAKAMAKVESGDVATKAMVDKLAAEFRDELANLGVRVDELESRMDNVKHSGFIRYRYRRDSGNSYDTAKAQDFVKFRLNSAVKINDKVDGFARIEWQHNNEFDKSANGELAQVWVHGKVGTTDIYAGKENPNDHSSFAHGLLLDTEITGGQVVFNKAIKDGNVSWTIDAGKSSNKDVYGQDELGVAGATGQTRIVGTHVNLEAGRFDASLGYYNFSNKHNLNVLGQTYGSWGTWAVGLGYKFGGDLYLTADYARASEEGIYHRAAGDNLGEYNTTTGKDAYNFQLNYKGAKASVAKSWGAYVGYQKLTNTAAPFATYDVAVQNAKGWKIGVDYTFMKNIVGSLQYFDGKIINGESGNDKARRFFGQVTFSF
ncbi:putative porin [Anaerovibrio lipolyticus]|uniref:S-layer homology domain-containing protein n=1 Tax=Anaerovibrio lipolyticus TaxID=82374 RepID=UPI0023EFEB44|nr:putative porin [Anaerovibrio lipolyticus]